MSLNIIKASSLFSLVLMGLFSGSAYAVTGTGISMKAAFGNDEKCLNRSSYGGIRNDCASPVEVAGTVSVPTGWHATSVSIFGNNSWCQTVAINGVGNGAMVGPVIWTSAGPQTWQSLNLGSLYVWDWTGVTFRCALEPAGIIGNYTAQ